MEALLAGALEPAPPPLADLVEPDLVAELPPDVVSLAHLGSPGFTLEDDHDALPLAA